MGVIAEVSRSSTVAWVPGLVSNSYMIAAGTMAGSLDSSFDSGGSLDILTVDLATRTLRPIVAPTRSQEKFCSLAWGGVSEEAIGSLGLVAGGMADGMIQIWDVNSLSNPNDQGDLDRGLVFGKDNDQSRHEGEVKALQFNTMNAYQLASGASDGELRVWDLGNASGVAVDSFPSQRGGGKDQITALAWNPKVVNIIGNTSSSGMSDIWDLRKKRKVISLRSPHGHPSCSSLAWNPEEATQVIIASDDTNASHAVLWDLRNSNSPIQEFGHHRGGILSVAWSPHDSDMVLTSGKDSRTVCFAPSSGEILCEIPSGSNWVNDIQWSPKLPGIFLTSSMDGNLSVHSISTPNVPHIPRDTEQSLANSFGMNASDFGAMKSPSVTLQGVEMRRAPKWFRRPIGVSFGYGNRMATFSSEEGNKVTITSAAIKSTLVEANEALEKALQSPSTIGDYLEEQKSTCSSDEAECFEILRFQFETNSRRKLLQYLGYASEDNQEISMDSTIAGFERSSPLNDLLERQAKELAVAENAATTVQSVGSTPIKRSSTGGGLIQKTLELNLDGPAPWDLDGDDSLLDSVPTEMPSMEENDAPMEKKADMDIEGVIRAAVVTGDFKRAVEKCLEADRIPDALVFAQCGGQELWAKTRSTFLRKHPQQIMSLVFNAVIDPTTSFDAVASYALSSPSAWNEVLAVFATYAPGPTFVDYFNRLATEVLARGRVKEALVCFLCSSNLEGAADLWSRSLAPANAKAGGGMYALRMDKLWELVKRLRLLEAAKLLGKGEGDLTTVKVEDDLSASAFLEFAMVLASEGALNEALKYFRSLRPDFHSAFGVAADELARAEKAVAGKRAAEAAVQAAASRKQQVQNRQYNAPQSNSQFPMQSQTQAQRFGQRPPQNAYGPSYPTSQSNQFQSNGSVRPWQPPQDNAGSIYPPTTQGLGPSRPSPTQMQPSPNLQLPPRQSNQMPPTPVPPVRQSPQMSSMPPNGMSPQMMQPMAPAPQMPPMQSQSPQMPSRQSPQMPPMRQSPQMPPVRQPQMPPPLKQSPQMPTMSSNGVNQPMMPPTAPMNFTPPPMMAAPPTQMPSMSNPTSSMQSYGDRRDIRSPNQPTQRAGSMGPMTVTPPVQRPVIPPPVSAISSAPFINAPPQMTGTPAMNTMQAMAPRQQAAPLPPPVSALGEDSPQMNYHANPRAGDGRRLPVSAEVAGVTSQNRPTSSTSSGKQGPPVTLDDVDTGNVPADQQRLVASIRNTYGYVRNLNHSPMYKKKMEDMSKRLGRLFQDLNGGEVGQIEITLLRDLCDALDQTDYETGLAVVKRLNEEAWRKDNHQWILALRWLIQSAQAGQ